MSEPQGMFDEAALRGAAATIMRGDELALTLVSKHGHHLLATDVAATLKALSGLLLEIAKEVAPGHRIDVALRRVDILDGQCRLTVRLIPRQKRTRRRRAAP